MPGRTPPPRRRRRRRRRRPRATTPRETSPPRASPRRRPPLGHPPTRSRRGGRRPRRPIAPVAFRDPLRVPGGGGAPTDAPFACVVPFVVVIVVWGPHGAKPRELSTQIRELSLGARAFGRDDGVLRRNDRAARLLRDRRARFRRRYHNRRVHDSRRRRDPDSRRRLPYHRDLRPELLHLRPRARARRRVPRAGARRRRHQRADDAHRSPPTPERPPRDAATGYKTPTGATTLAATAAMRVDDADARRVDERGDEHRAEDERDGAPRVGLVPALLLLLLLMLIGAGRITRGVRLDRGVVDRPRVREGPQSPHPARGGGARHDAAPASSDTADAVDAPSMVHHERR